CGTARRSWRSPVSMQPCSGSRPPPPGPRSHCAPAKRWTRKTSPANCSGSATRSRMSDQPGEAAIRGAVLDAFPAAALAPYRVEHADGRITEIRAYDPLTQRSRDSVAELSLGPASELPPPTGGEGTHPPGIEHGLAAITPGLVSLF